MDEQSYEGWLRKQGLSAKTISNYPSHLRRIEEEYGDIDGHYDRDQFSFLMNELDYDAAGRGNVSRISIDGGVQGTLSTLRSALRSYSRFRRSPEGADFGRSPPRGRLLR